MARKPNAQNGNPEPDGQDDDVMGAPFLDDSLDFADGEEVTDEEDERVRKFYGLDEADEEAEAGAADDAGADAEEAPPAGDAGAPPADDAAAEAGSEQSGEKEPADGEPSADAPPAAGQDGQPPSTPAQPFKLRVDKKEIEVPGSLEFEADLDGQKIPFVTMPKAAIERYLRPYMADRQQFRTEKLELLRRVADAETQVTSHPDIVIARKVNSVLDELLELHGSDQTGDKVLAKLDEIAGSYTEWQRNAEIEARDRRIEAMRKVQRPADEVLDQLEEEDRMDRIRGELGEKLGQLVQSDPRYGAVDAAELLGELVEDYRRIIFEAEEDLKDAQGQVIVRKGEPFVHLGEIRRRLEREARRFERVRSSLTQRQQAEERNRRALGKGGKQAPKPAVAAAARVTSPPEGDDDAYEQWRRDYLGEPEPEIVD